MKITVYIRKFLPTALILLVSCVEPYLPEISSSTQGLLVIDSFFNTNGKSEVILSRSTSLYSTADAELVTKAIVKVEDKNGSSYSFSESAPGHYTTYQSNLPLDMSYRLVVTTTDNKSYASPFVQASPSPEIDSLTWELTKDNDVQIYANSRDLQNKTKRYLWKYTETWLYTSAFQSAYTWDNGSARLRDRSDDIYHCYQTAYSTKILYSTTQTLAQDIVSRFPVTLIPQKSERLSNKYSILVSQFGLTQEGLDYWTELKKNTENLGSLFDPQPSIVTGNFKNVNDPNEAVLGFFSAGISSEKRIFIPVEKLTRLTFQLYDTQYNTCAEDLLKLSALSSWKGSALETLIGPVYSIPTGSGPPILLGFSKSSNQCVDCRRKNGTNVRPSFWE